MNHAMRMTLAAALVFAMTGAGLAEVLFVGARTEPATGGGKAFANVPLLNTGTFQVGFTTTSPNETVVVTYNAECSRLGTKGYVTIRIEVNNKVADPKVGKDFVFCSSTDGVSAVRTAFFKVAKPGFGHLVRVKAATVGGANGWRLDDSTILIQK